MKVEVLIRRVVDGKTVFTVELVDSSYEPSRSPDDGGDYRSYNLRKNFEANLPRFRCCSEYVLRNPSPLLQKSLGPKTSKKSLETE